MTKTAKNNHAVPYDEARILVAEELRPWLHKVVKSHAEANKMLKEITLVKEVSSIDMKMNLLFQRMGKSVKMYNEWIMIQSNIKSDILRVFQPLKKVKRFSIRSLQILSEVFLNEYRAAINTVYQCNNFEWLKDEDLDYLVKVATSIYLERWLEKDRRSRKSINEFSKYGYADATNKTSGYTDDKEKVSKLYRAHKKYHDLFVLRQTQAKEDHERMPVAPYRRNNKTAYDIITLSWFDAWTKDYIQLLEFWLYRKHFINRKSKRDAKQNEKICDVLGKYYDFLLEIDYCFSQAGSNPIKNIEYVANCMLVQKIERVYHFHLIADIVRYCQQFNLELNDFNTAIMAAYFGRYSEIGGILFDSYNVFGPDGQRKYIRSNDPLGVMNYERIIHSIVHTHDPDKIDEEVKKELMRRGALMDLLTLMYMVFPFDQQHAWEIVDFKNAANFYNSEYPIISDYTIDEKLPPDVVADSAEAQENAHCFYDLFHEFYMHIYNMPDSQLKIAVEELSKKRSVNEY